MEKNNIALSDTERNKELFEYEMTEVILQLKGEFAKVSGKDLQLDESQFETPSIEIRSDITNVEIQPISIASIGAEATVSGETFAIPEIVVENSKIDCPAVPAPVVAMPSKVTVDQPVLDCKTVDKVKAYSTTEANIDLPVISAVVPNVSVKEIPEIIVSDIGTQSVNAAMKLPRTETAANIEAIKVDIPDLAINVSKMNTNTVASAPSIAVDVDVPVISANYSPVSIKVKPNDVSDIAVPKVAEFTAHEVSLQGVNIQTPKIPKIKKYNGETIILSNQETEPLDLPKIKTAMFSPTTVEPATLEVDAVQVPDMSALPTEGVNIKIEKPTIDYEYPTAKVAEIPPVSIIATENFDVPAIPDYKSVIQELIDSAV